jgi:hypothetical protein
VVVVAVMAVMARGSVCGRDNDWVMDGWWLLLGVTPVTLVTELGVGVAVGLRKCWELAAGRCDRRRYTETELGNTVREVLQLPPLPYTEPSVVAVCVIDDESET